MNNRIDSLQTVRTLAYIGILTSHCTMTQLGAWGVSVFFVLSGFVMSYAYSDRELDCSFINNLKFSVGKIKKLYLLHIITMISAFYFMLKNIMPNPTGLDIKITLAELFLNITLLQAWVPSIIVNFSYNGVAWFLSVSLFAYFAYPFFSSKIKKLSIPKTVCGILIIYALQFALGYASNKISIPGDYFVDFPMWFTYMCPLFRFGDFLIGSFAGHIYATHEIKINVWISTILELAAFALIYIGYRIYLSPADQAGEWYRYTLVFTPSSVILVFLFAANCGLISKVLTCKPVIYIGNISAYCYLIHMMLVRYTDVLTTKYLGHLLQPHNKAIMVFFVTIILAEGYRGIERLWKKRH